MRKKLLLMGMHGAGKTSMRGIIFANLIPRDTRRLGPTFEVESANVRFLTMVLNLWDCGGQERFMEGYLNNNKENIFKNVEVMIYVFNVESVGNDNWDKDLKYFRTSLDSLRHYSPNARLFCLVHKMDLFKQAVREDSFKELANKIQYVAQSEQPPLCFPTSIWDDSLYHAWSMIVCQLIPNVMQLTRSLGQFCSVLEADEAVLFERATFLKVTHVCRTQTYSDMTRFEKISNVVKQFKLACSKMPANFSGIEIVNKDFAAFIDVFTPNTYIMVITSNSPFAPSTTKLNIKTAKVHFEKLERESTQASNIVTGI